MCEFKIQKLALFNYRRFENKRIVVTIRERNPQNNGFILEFVREL